jgi:hypothetical protein
MGWHLMRASGIITRIYVAPSRAPCLNVYPLFLPSLPVFLLCDKMAEFRLKDANKPKGP